MKIIKKPEQVKYEINSLLLKYGVSSENAEIVASSLVFADMRGTKSHGLNMLEAYLQRIRSGGMNPQAIPEILNETQTTAVVDGKNGFGQVAAQKAVEIAIRKAKENNISGISIRNSNHCGALAYYTKQITESGLIGFMFANVNPSVAPFGGMESVLGTNPLSIAMTCPKMPIILDMATSTVAKAKIYQARQLGQSIDPSWAIDIEGNPTSDPDAAIKGVLTPMAGPKGYGLAVAVEVLAGVMTGAGITKEISSVHQGVDKGMNAGAFIMAINPGAFIEVSEFMARIEALSVEIKNSKPQPGKTIFIPGEIEEENYKKALRYGIEYEEGFYSKVLGGDGKG